MIYCGKEKQNIPGLRQKGTQNVQGSESSLE